MIGGWFEQDGAADSEEAQFLAAFESIVDKLPSLGIAPEQTGFEGPLGVGGPFLLRMEVIDDVLIHVDYSALELSHRVSADWSFDGYVLDGRELHEVTLESPSAAGEWAATWVEAQLRRGLFRDEWDGRHPHSDYRFDNEPVGRHWFRGPDRSVRVR